MGKFDLETFKYLKKDDFRVLTGVEMGMKNHEFVPSQLLFALANCKGGKTYDTLRSLCRQRLLVYEKSSQGEGYRLTFSGYDALALNALCKRGVVTGFGSKIGVGKESDIFVATNDCGNRVVLKFHRLGRNSFRKIKEKRDYLGRRRHSSWLYLSRLAATKEYEFLKILKRNQFPVPQPLDCNRHCVVMELVDGFPLCQVTEIPDAPALFSECMDIIVRLAEYGLIHGDFNEFNLLYIEGDLHIVVIDLPQMVSVDHTNAKFYFDRDVKCICDMFKRKFGFIALEFPTLESIERITTLDQQVFASGFTKEMNEELHKEVNDNEENLESSDKASCISKNCEEYLEEEDYDDDESDLISTQNHKNKEPLIETVQPIREMREPGEGSVLTPDQLEQVHELVEAHERLEMYALTNKLKNTVMDDAKKEDCPSRMTTVGSTFSHFEIAARVRKNMHMVARQEKYKRSLKLANKKGDSLHNRSKKGNYNCIREAIDSDF